LTEASLQAISELRESFGSPLKGTNFMNWETPSFEEIDMSAEIGSYQGEDDNGL